MIPVYILFFSFSQNAAKCYPPYFPAHFYSSTKVNCLIAYTSFVPKRHGPMGCTCVACNKYTFLYRKEMFVTLVVRSPTMKFTSGEWCNTSGDWPQHDQRCSRRLSCAACANNLAHCDRQLQLYTIFQQKNCCIVVFMLLHEAFLHMCTFSII